MYARDALQFFAEAGLEGGDPIMAVDIYDT
jgi:hypothetical protein